MQITLETEIQLLASQRAHDLGISLAEYVRRLLARDLEEPKKVIDISCVFNLGTSGGSDVARDKDVMIAEAFAADHQRSISQTQESQSSPVREPFRRYVNLVRGGGSFRSLQHSGARDSGFR